MHRIAASTRYSASLLEIESQWSMVQVEEAHAVEDAIEFAEAQAMRDAQKRTGSR